MTLPSSPARVPVAPGTCSGATSPAPEPFPFAASAVESRSVSDRRLDGRCQLPGGAGCRVEAPPSLSPRWWHDDARALARTHTRRQAAEALGLDYRAVKDFARRYGVAFVPAAQPVREPMEADDDEPAGMDDDERCRLLAVLLDAERRDTRRRALDRRLLDLTSRPEPARDVAGALAKLEAV